VTQGLGFPQTLQSGSQVISFDNTVVLSPTITWQQRAGFTRMQAYAGTTDGFTPSQFGINLPGGAEFPEIKFAKAESNLGGTFTFGSNWDHTQLSIINNNSNGDILSFTSFATFLEGTPRTGSRPVRRPHLNPRKKLSSHVADSLNVVAITTTSARAAPIHPTVNRLHRSGNPCKLSCGFVLRFTEV